MRKRLVAVGAGVVLFGVLIVLYIAIWATDLPAPAAATTTGAGAARETQLTLETVAAVGPAYSPQHPDWVSYLVRRHGRWIHSTIFTLPAHTLVRVTIYQYDSATGLRNPFLSQAQGVGGLRIDGRPTIAINPDDTSHTFAVPELGIFVPLPGISATAKNPCNDAPCALSEDHRTITFTFRTGDRGRYRWQCFVPCGAGTLLGNGGPMQTLGYMDGFLDVV